MNAKELRKAAEWLKYLAYPRVCYEEFRGIDGTETREKFNTIAEYVLARLRDDDDEPVNDDWLSGVQPSASFAIHTNGIQVEAHYLPEGNFYWGYSGSAIYKMTRSQFRALCKGLGIELKEESC